MASLAGNAKISLPFIEGKGCASGRTSDAGNPISGCEVRAGFDAERRHTSSPGKRSAKAVESKAHDNWGFANDGQPGVKCGRATGIDPAGSRGQDSKNVSARFQWESGYGPVSGPECCAATSQAVGPGYTSNIGIEICGQAAERQAVGRGGKR